MGEEKERSLRNPSKKEQARNSDSPTKVCITRVGPEGQLSIGNIENNKTITKKKAQTKNPNKKKPLKYKALGRQLLLYNSPFLLTLSLLKSRYLKTS